MKTKFGVKQIKNPTPVWALWMFRIVFLLNKIIIGYLAATNLLSPDVKYEVTVFLAIVVDPFAFGLSKMFGIPVEDK